MKNDTILRRSRAALLAALVALLMVATAVPASADEAIENISWESGCGETIQNISWESCAEPLLNISWE